MNFKIMLMFLIMQLPVLEAASQEMTTKEGKTKMTTINLTKEDFLNKVMDYEKNPTEWKYKGDKPAIIDFYASWCGPCKMLAPVLEELAKEYEGQIYIYKVDTEAEEELSRAFGIRSIPTMLFVPMNGQPMMTQGALPKAELDKIIKERLLKRLQDYRTTRQQALFTAITKAHIN